MSNDTKQWFIRGLRDGLPIGLGYFAVAFALGIQASGAGMTALAGEAAAIALIGAGTT